MRDFLWDDVWENDIYSDDQIRKEKAEDKLKIFESLGFDRVSINNIIDFGCGAGYVSSAIVKKIQTSDLCTVTLLDNSVEALSKAKIKLSEFKDIERKFVHYDLNNYYDTTKKYDLAVCFSLIEHLKNVENAILSIFDSLKSNGKLLLVWSNKTSIFRLQHLIYKRLNKWRYGYTNEITNIELEKHIKKYFKVISYKIVPCTGGKGVLTKIDGYLNKLNKKYGRYIFMVCERR